MQQVMMESSDQDRFIWNSYGPYVLPIAELGSSDTHYFAHWRILSITTLPLGMLTSFQNEMYDTRDSQSTFALRSRYPSFSSHPFIF